ncbi:Protein N-acetyltransferase, RimJ/RimL family [Rheinheimera pacifica]|uniref:Protein N-acetyltransferase, RimJ/RimL family n=1 Tax=Rheinheimera pacifica TaxID=173990 RepID=A0A1H6MP80_9GAMM|nr:GNAT family N-acetyltransferase [Rheinheimera pacifica]SEH99704.1 Protein N-acetyltransferase, RimJ/RimL family [Rheinheimera pacifica]
MSVSVMLRLATMADAELLLRWRNDADTQRFSLNSDQITEQQHIRWLQQSLSNPQRRLYIAEYADQPAGTVRVDSTADYHRISWTVAAEYRGKGLAKAMVKLLVSQLTGTIVAEILPGNTASVCVAEYAGLTYQNTHNGIMYYESQTPG